MLWGAFIGDALGLPFEAIEPGKIEHSLREQGHYIPIGEHCFLPPSPPGTWSDDTQLTLAVIDAIENSGKLSLESQIESHLKAYKESTFGWGGTTIRGMKRLSAGEPPSESGKPLNGKGALGNGVVIQLAPIAAYIKKPQART